MPPLLNLLSLTHQTILELSDGWDCITPLGEGVVLLITTPSYLGNSTLYVKLKNGQLKHFDSNDIRLMGSPTYGENLMPDVPDSWKKDDSKVTKIPPGAKRNTDFLNKT